MVDLTHLLAVADAYKAATSLEDVTVSNRVFGDGKKLTAMRSGADITLGRFNSALLWFSCNWPDGAKWPESVSRPQSQAA